MHTTLIVLAAGLGTRFGGAKQIEPFGPRGETLLELNIHDALCVGVRRLVVVTREVLAQDIEGLLAAVPSAIESHVVIQENEVRAIAHGARAKPWGTAHAVLAAGVPPAGAIVANADDLYGRAAFASLQEALPATREDADVAVLAGYRLHHTLSDNGGVSRGGCTVDERGRLEGIEEVTDLRRVGSEILGIDASGTTRAYAESATVSMNLWGLSPWWWPRLGSRFELFLAQNGQEADAEFRLPDVVGAEVALGAQVRVAPTNAEWAGVTHAADRGPVQRTISKLFSEGHYPSPLFSEVGP